jgi:endonuclease YncB( thermonuclease family)
VPLTKTPVSVPATPGKPTPAKPSPATAKPQTATQQTAPPPASTPAATNTTTPPAAKPAKSTPPAALPAAAATDPHKLDPNANSKFKIELSHMPNGVPLTVEMNKAVYLRFISGDKTDLNNLFVPPGTQAFQVVAKNGNQQVVSNIASSEFKAKKKKNFKIDLQNQTSVPAGAGAPLSPSAKIVVSLSTPIF